MNPPDLSFIIVSYNTREMLRECLEAIFEHTTGLAFEVIVVDNASSDGSVEFVRTAFPQIRLVALDKNVGFGLGNNAGVDVARGRYLFLLNSDAILMENTALSLVQHLDKRNDIACIGPRIVMPGGMLQPKSFGHLPNPWRLLMQSLGLGYLGVPMFEGVDGVRRGGRETDVGWLSGVCLCLRREDYLAIGGFDARFFMYGEDVALCARLRRTKGRVVLLDCFDVLHYGGASSPALRSRVRNAVWQQRHILQICQDEFGWWARFVSTGFVIVGLVLRLGAALMMVPLKGVGKNAGLHSSWARLLDILGRRTIPDVPQAASCVN